jgi:basic amino acid/polyamine antiporter, APA family
LNIAGNSDREGHGGHLRRTLGLWPAITIVIGTIIGSGIFLVPSDMVKAVGSPAMVFAVWIFGGFLTLFGALSYAELAAAMPASGGEFVYLTRAYGPLFGFFYGWTQTVVGKCASIAALGAALVIYLGDFFPGLERVWFHAPLPIGPAGAPFEIRYGQLVAMSFILLLTAVNYAGTRIGGGVQVAGTFLKMGLIGAIVVVGLAGRAGTASNFAIATHADPGGMSGFFAALVAALWAYDGWNNGPMVGAEIQHPEKNLPRALIGGTLVVMATYLLTNLAYFYVLSGPEVGSSARVATDMMRKVLGPSGGSVVTVAALISIFASLNGVILSGARVPFAMARSGYFFAWAGRIHPKFGTPAGGLLFLGFFSSLLLLSGRFQELARMVIFSEWIFYAMTAFAVIALRRSEPHLPRPYRVHGYPLVPVVFVLVAAGLLWSTLLTYPRESGLGLVLIAAGLPFYSHWKKAQRGPAGVPHV